jgi:hypothetical protein
MQVPVTKSRSSHHRILALAVGLVAAAALAVPVAGAFSGQRPYSLLISSYSDRSAAVPLAGAQVGATDYIFLAPPEGVARVDFWYDDPEMKGPPTHQEWKAPFDFVGTNSVGRAMPWSASSNTVGKHTITTRVTGRFGNGTFATVFTVQRGIKIVPASPAPSTGSVGTLKPGTPAPATSTPVSTSAPTAAATTANPTTAPTATPVRTPTPTIAPTPRPATPTPQPTTGGSDPNWTTVVDDQFDSGGVPSHWDMYNGPYGSGPHNCATPSQDTVSGGSLHLTMAYRSSGTCGAGWYTGGLALRGFSTIDQRVTVRFRIVRDGSLQSHFIIPMRWPDNDSSWPAGGEEDYFEGDTNSSVNTFLHYGSSNSQVASGRYNVDLSQWHTIQTTRRNHVATVSIDGQVAFTYSGSASTLPDTLKHVVLQQECTKSCPSGTGGTEDIQIDWITIENPR